MAANLGGYSDTIASICIASICIASICGQFAGAYICWCVLWNIWYSYIPKYLVFLKGGYRRFTIASI